VSKYRLDGWWSGVVCVAVFFTLVSLGSYAFVVVIAIGELSPLYRVSFFITSPDSETLLLLLVIYPVFSYVFWRVALHARQRARRRTLALAGNLSAMPLARLDSTESAQTANTAEAQPSNDQQVYIGWREPHYANWWITPVYAIFGLFALMSIPFIALFVMITKINTLVVVIVFVGLIIACFTVYIIGLRRLANQQPTPQQRVTHLIADASGLTWNQPCKRAVVIRWEDARLLEVWTAPMWGTPAQVNRLFGAGKAIIVWPQFGPHVKPPIGYEPDEITEDQLARRLQDILILIRHRTYLAPRSFDPELTDERMLTDASNMFTAFTTFFIVAVFGVLPLIGASLIVLKPLTAYPLANVYGALTLVLIGVGSITLFIRGQISRARRRQRFGSDSAPPSYALPPAPTNANSIYTLCVTRPNRERLLSGLIGILGLLDGVVVFLSFVAPGHAFHPGSLGYNFETLLQTPLAIVTFASLYLLSFDTLRPAIALYGATSEGLAMRRNIRIMRIIRWRDIVYVATIRRAGVVTGFEAIATNGERISWPAIAPQSSTRHSARDRSAPVAPDELAALVVARTGLTLEARET